MSTAPDTGRITILALLTFRQFRIDYIWLYNDDSQPCTKTLQFLTLSGAGLGWYFQVF